MIDYTKLPLAASSFKDFVDEGLVYVDKTDLIASIAKFRNPFFLSRPRRFGKSTLVNTFHELFSQGLEKFEDLKIAREHLWQDRTYSVVHLDFSEIKEKSDISFRVRLLNLLKLSCSDFVDDRLSREFSIYDQDPGTFLGLLLKRFSDRKFVLLVDEYDAPLTAVMHEADEFEKRRAVLSDFFSSVKKNSGSFRFIFITGVTRYANTSIFSAFNTLRDLTFEPEYGSLTGYTQKELEFYFKDYLENAVKVLNHKAGISEYTYKSLIEAVKTNYDGYCFDKECRQHVYNPWSILNFLMSPSSGFEPYWLDSGGAKPALIVNYLNSFSGAGAANAQLSDFLDLEFTKVVETEDLSPSIIDIHSGDFPFFAILYQAGYFTIKSSDDGFLKIGLPNLEVKTAFAKLVLEELTGKETTEMRSFYRSRIREAIKNSSFKGFKVCLSEVLNELSYESISTFNEAAFRDIFKIALLAFGFNTYTEYQTALGRSDVCFECGNKLCVIEFKLAGKAEDVPKKLEEAEKQIADRKYLVRLTEKEVIAMACVILNQQASGENAARREVAALAKVN